MRLRTGGPLQHRRQLAAFLDHRVNHRRVNFALADARARALRHHVDGFLDQLDRFGESVDLLRALDVPGSLHQIGGVDEGCVREGFLDGAHGAVRHNAFRRSADVVEPRDADAALVDVQLPQPLDDPPPKVTVAVAHVRDPVLEREPVVDRRDRHRDRRDFTLQGKDRGGLAAVAAHARQVARVGLKVIPMAGVHGRDDHIQPFFGHELAHEPPAPVPLGEREARHVELLYWIHFDPPL